MWLERVFVNKFGVSLYTGCCLLLLLLCCFSAAPIRTCIQVKHANGNVTIAVNSNQRIFIHYKTFPNANKNTHLKVCLSRWWRVQMELMLAWVEFSLWRFTLLTCSRPTTIFCANEMCARHSVSNELRTVQLKDLTLFGLSEYNKNHTLKYK